MMSLTVKATIYPIRAVTPHRVAIVARPRGGDWLCDELSALSSEGIDVLVSMLTDEESTELGLERESADCEAAAITATKGEVVLASLSKPTFSPLARQANVEGEVIVDVTVRQDGSTEATVTLEPKSLSTRLHPDPHAYSLFLQIVLGLRS